MTRFKTIALALCGVSLLAGGAAMAEDGMKKDGPRPYMKMMEKDTNGDGAISKAEFLAGAEDHFAKLDSDGDGTITKEEFQAHHEKMREKFKKWKEKKRGGEDVKEDAPEAPSED